MIRSGTTTTIAALALALVGCGKKNEKKQEAPPALQHGKMEGKGTGGGEKSASGSKDGVKGSGKAAAAGDAALIQRGGYLASLGGCGLCHMPMTEQGPDMTRMFAGGFTATEKLPDGSTFQWRGANITPDKDTGIGAWTDQQLATAIREGVRPDGRRLSPIMPYMLYNRLTDDDVKAMAAFLRSLPPIANKVEPVDSSKLLAMMPPVPPAKNEPVGADPVAKGAYTASLMHCVLCHTPLGPQGPDMSKAFAGGTPMEVPPMFGTGVLYASNITSDPETGIGKWTEADIIKAVTAATRPDGRPIQGPMQFYAPMWSQLTDEDAGDLARFVKSIPPIVNKVPASTFTPAGPPPGVGGPPGGAPPAPPSSPSGGPAKGT
jgi:cytochrome c553